MKNARGRLDSDRIIEAAMVLADRVGMEKLTMRSLADELKSAPMTLYHHIESKDRLIDAMVDRVFSEITLPPEDEHWKDAMRLRCQSARELLNRHWWAAPLMESRQSPGPANLRHHDTVIGCLRRSGFSVSLASRAYAVLDSYVFGFAFEEANIPSGAQELTRQTSEILETFPLNDYPHLAEMAREHILQPDYRFGDSFLFGLNLLLDGLEKNLTVHHPRNSDGSA